MNVPVRDSRASSEFDFSPRATIPKRINFPLPLPGSDDFRRVRGRSGDMLVLQLKSAVGQKPARREALRTLSLHGPRTAALRFTHDTSAWGLIDTVKDLVSVIILPGVVYTEEAHNAGKLDGNAATKSYTYGSESQPGQLWRDDEGKYFAFEYSKNSLVAFWSSARTLLELTEALPNAGMQIDRQSSDAYLLAGTNPSTVTPEFNHNLTVDVTLDGRQRLEGTWPEVSERVNIESADAAVIPMVGGFEVTWQARHARFHDSPILWAAVGVNSAPPDVLAVRALARITGSVELLEQGCSVSVRQHGTVRKYQI